MIQSNILKGLSIFGGLASQASQAKSQKAMAESQQKTAENQAKRAEAYQTRSAAYAKKTAVQNKANLMALKALNNAYQNAKTKKEQKEILAKVMKIGGEK